VAEDAQIGWPKLPVGGGFISPVWSWFVGPRRAKEFSFVVGTTFSGRDAEAMGWANRAVPADQLGAYTLEIARKVALVPAVVLAMKKAAINTTMDLRGFSTSIKMTAAWDAAAHASPSVEKIRVKIREVGLRKAIDWFDQGGMQDEA
jgi:enoyl-CoA hydratase